MWPRQNGGTCLHRSLCSWRPQGGVSVGCGYRLRAALNRRCARRQESQRGDEDSQPCHLPASRSREAPQGRRALHTSATAREAASRVGTRGGSPISPVSGELRASITTRSGNALRTSCANCRSNHNRQSAAPYRRLRTWQTIRDCSNFSSHTSEARCARTRRSLLDDQGLLYTAASLRSCASGVTSGTPPGTLGGRDLDQWISNRKGAA